MAVGRRGKIRCKSFGSHRGNESLSVLEIDSRVDLSEWTQSIEEHIYNRIFILGLNSDDKKMKRRKRLSKLDTQRMTTYRVYTGKLSRSLRVEYEVGFLYLTFKRKRVILDCLSTRYGLIFQFSPSDIEYIESIIKRLLTQNGFNQNTIKKSKIV